MKFFGSKSNFEYIVVGLGNPGLQYENTRHNIGFKVMDVLAEKFGTEIKKNKFSALTGETTIAGKRCLLLKPQTFMNCSGQSVSEAMKFYKIPSEKVIVIFDDITLDVGRLRIRGKGSDGGHRGMRDIIQLGGTDLFPRIKIGVGQKPHPDYDVKDWVLGKFSADDQKILTDIKPLAVEAVESIIKTDIPTAMNRFNR